jgi:hypothetical protein
MLTRIVSKPRKSLSSISFISVTFPSAGEIRLPGGSVEILLGFRKKKRQKIMKKKLKKARV